MAVLVGDDNHSWEVSRNGVGLKETEHVEIKVLSSRGQRQQSLETDSKKYSDE